MKIPNAFYLRQKDRGWGYAIAHLFPFVFLYYAFTRRTITPFLFQMGGSFLISILFGLYVGLFNPIFVQENEKDFNGNLSKILIIFQPLFVKIGINKSRKYAELKIEEQKNFN